MVRIRVERSGGFAGIPIANEIDSKNLPPTLVTKLNKIIENAKSPKLPLSATPRGAADHFTYKILVKDGEKETVIECNQYSLEDDLRSLVKYVERNSEKK